MSKFDSHFRMNEADAIEYIREKMDFFPKDAKLTCKEIGDGNINYVFRVQDEATGKSIIIKHSDTSARSTGQHLDTDHNRIEAEILKLEAEYAPGLVPEVYLYDGVMCCMCMQDLKDYENMRHAMIKHENFPGFAETITNFMAYTLIRSTDSIITPHQKRLMAKQFTNPDLCEVTERLVYTDPYTNASGRNIVFEPNKAFLEKELYEDMALRLEVAKLKEEFKANNQSLIHGDLHTSSIMVKQGSTMVLDPEFACYAPAGYDVGNLIANLTFAWANAEVTMPAGAEKEAHIAWLEESIEKSIDLFAEKALVLLKAEATDKMAQTPGFAEWFIDGILRDTAGVCGCELNRRIIGSAKVKDVAGIEDAAQRTLAERICVLTAKDCIMNRAAKFRKGADYLTTIHEATAKAKAL